MTDTIRDALNAAFEKAEAPEEAAPAEAPAPVEAEPAAPPAEENAAPTLADKPVASRERGPDGKFVKKDAKPAEVKPTEAKPVESKPPVDAPPAEAKPAEPSRPNEAGKPPQSWKFMAREVWSQIPQVAREEWVRREREMSAAINEAAAARKFHGEFERVVAPFMAFIQAEGSNPLAAVQNLMQTAAALRTAPPAHKAQLVANLVKTYGVPVDALDAALVGQPAPVGHAPPEYRDPRVDQLIAQIQQAQQNSTANVQRQVASELEKFAAEHEFFDDVREDMADLIEMAARRGVELSPEDAYTRAVNMNSGISEVMKQREAAKAAQTASATTARAKAAASSVRGSPAPTPVKDESGGSIRGALEAAFEAHSRR